MNKKFKIGLLLLIITANIIIVTTSGVEITTYVFDLFDNDNDNKFERFTYDGTIVYDASDEWGVFILEIAASVIKPDGSEYTVSWWDWTLYTDDIDLNLGTASFSFVMFMSQLHDIPDHMVYNDFEPTDIKFYLQSLKLSGDSTEYLDSPIELATEEYQNIDFRERISLFNLEYDFIDSDDVPGFDVVRVITNYTVIEIIEFDLEITITIQSSVNWYQKTITTTPASLSNDSKIIYWTKSELFADGVPSGEIYWSLGSRIVLLDRYVSYESTWTDELVIDEVSVITTDPFAETNNPTTTDTSNSNLGSSDSNQVTSSDDLTLTESGLLPINSLWSILPIFIIIINKYFSFFQLSKRH